jgi:hypothetical protein
MPTYELTARFWSDYDQLSLEEKEAFDKARRTFTAVLTAWERGGCQGQPSFPKRLGIKRMKGYVGINELAWAPDGRATWQYGETRTANKSHIIWRRVGTHRIYTNP